MVTLQISIHSLVKRETPRRRGAGAHANNFNPLPRKEGDYASTTLIYLLSISIHSLVKRETGNALLQSGSLGISIHSLVKRETIALCAFVSIMSISIHSLVKRETICKCRRKWYGIHFNPLPRKEGDNRRGLVEQFKVISIHSLVKRETKVIFGSGFLVSISIHSLVKRETDWLPDGVSLCRFQSTPS